MVTHNVFRKMQGRDLSGPTIKRDEGSGLTIQLLWQSRSKRRKQDTSLHEKI